MKKYKERLKSKEMINLVIKSLMIKDPTHYTKSLVKTLEKRVNK
jgi:hypothetical protein